MTRSPKEDRDLAAFGKRLSKIRKERGITQEALAEKIGLSAHSLAFIEQGRRWPRLSTIHAIAKGLDVKTDEFFRGLNG